MASRHQRSGMRRIYVGDIGEIPTRTEPEQLDDTINIDTLDDRAVFNLLLAIGTPVQDLIGVYNCFQHPDKDYIFLGNKAMPTGFTLFENGLYCRNCFQMFRTRKK